VNNREREEPDGSFFVGRVIRVYIVVFVLGAGFGLALGFYAGITARTTEKEKRRQKWKRRR